MKICSLVNLKVWQKSSELVKYIYNITGSFSADEKFALLSQLRRVVVSIASNIAEGTSRKSNKNKAHFIRIAFCSKTEVLNQIIISKELGYISEKDYILVRNKIETITHMLNALRKADLNA